MTTINEAIEDKNLFGPLFKNPNTWTNWKAALKAFFGLPMNKEELAVYQRYTARKSAPENQFKEIFVIAGRRAGKSFISAIIACYLALFRDWRAFLAPGEIGWIMVIAADRQQAMVILNYIKSVLQLKMFKGMIEKLLTWEVRLSNQVIISVKTCDYRTLRGFTVLAAICDEIAFWRSEGANPAQEILTALRPALATIPGSLLLGISTPYSKIGPLYESFRDKYGQDDPHTLVWKAPTKDMNPMIQDQVIDNALREDYSAAKSEWLAEFRDDLETFLSTEMIEHAIITGRFELPKIDANSYVAFVDPSGGRADSFTLALAHRDEEFKKVILDRIEERPPPFKPQDVVKEFSKILKEDYGIFRVTGDRYAGEWVSRTFEEEGINFSPSKLNKSEIYLYFEPLIAQGQIELLDSKRLFNQLKGLERRTRSGGKDSVDHYPGSHDDVANAAVGALVLAASQEEDSPGWTYHIGMRGNFSEEEEDEESSRDEEEWEYFSQGPSGQNIDPEEFIRQSIAGMRKPPEDD